MEHNQAHAPEDVPVDAFDDGVTHLVMGHVSPPEQDVRLGEHLLVKAVLIIGGEDRRRDVRLRVVRAKARGDGAVDAIRVDVADVGWLVDGLVDPLIPHPDPQLVIH